MLQRCAMRYLVSWDICEAQPLLLDEFKPCTSTTISSFLFFFRIQDIFPSLYTSILSMSISPLPREARLNPGRRRLGMPQNGDSNQYSPIVFYVHLLTGPLKIFVTALRTPRGHLAQSSTKNNSSFEGSYSIQPPFNRPGFLCIF